MKIGRYEIQYITCKFIQSTTTTSTTQPTTTTTLAPTTTTIPGIPAPEFPSNKIPFAVAIVAVGTMALFVRKNK